MARVVFDHVEKRYGRGEPVVRDLSLTVQDQELLVLVGPSGCGKSTALRMIAGLEDVSAGTLSIGDRCVNDVAPKDRDVAMVFQNYALYPHMTCFANMAFALELRRAPREEIDRRVRAAARVLAIEHLLGRKPKELSGGQRQRVAIGRAIVREPQVFLMDEPLSNLDAQLRTSMRTEMKRLHRRLGATIVYVTHDQTEAMTLGDRIAVMRGGDLLQCDTPQAIYARPATSFVATFIGSPEMNLLAGELLASDGAPAVVGRGFRVRPAIAAHAPREVLVGVRPEHLVLAEGDSLVGEDAAFAVRGAVELVESTGGEAYVHLATEAGRLVCKRAGDAAPTMGENVELRARAEHVHVFDKSSEARLS